MALNGKVASASMTHTGLVRNNNEDAVGEVPDIGLLVLADGMGGYNAGEIASGIAVATVLDVTQRRWSERRTGHIDAESGYSGEALIIKDAVEQAHRAIHGASISQPQCAGMGTTIVVCVLHDDRASIAYVGDSRLYRYRSGHLEQITRDHSLLEELIARGHYSREEASRLVRKNIVTRALGVEPDVLVDIIEEPVEVGDILLLCSDGLTDMVADEIISATVGKYADNLEKMAAALVEIANQNGGKDNVSVVLARIDSSFARGRRWYERLMEWF
ncbi:Stp1/IreP family PP2C-type Ser/Thr phosphatase [Sinimarinibacterium sp. CAU 1509]|uniref:Stp1/IreP family PP2C-type Ser/Thr phosphatase n=1 Tax=Sinimarinibacterium sp. CAU 1509 TaxID=2562283 RepID=UPI0010AD2611|nr:Stp1/IreP family PP2C-type Ser/Thr phosphatase [Sinimarinibacterium sp. CAU 1509]TJY62111.1 Stp1/IreP family PP2C-type Ser/Thr phosphatase [Sinimarinibacterium sp. CAU 1509]